MREVWARGMKGKRRPGRILRWLGGLLLAAVFVRSCNNLTGLSAQLEEEREVCERPPILARLPSPDGAWEAVVYRRICVFGMMAGQTSVSTEVRLLLTRVPSRAETVLKVSDGNDSMRPRLAWVAPDVLRINIRNLPFLVDVLACSFDGVRIEPRFDPDTPQTEAAKASREEYLRRYGISPGPVRNTC